MNIFKLLFRAQDYLYFLVILGIKQAKGIYFTVGIFRFDLTGY